MKTSPATASSLIEFDGFRVLEYPPQHPLTLAREFALCAGNGSVAIAPFDSVIEAWIRNQQPDFAVKLLMECVGQTCFTDRACAFATAAVAEMADAEPMLRSIEGHIEQESAVPLAHANSARKCAFRSAVCEAYARRKQVAQVAAWFARIGNSEWRKMTVDRIAGAPWFDEECVEQWAASVPADADARKLWSRAVYARLQRGDVDGAIALLDDRLGGEARAPLETIGALILALHRNGRTTEAVKRLDAALSRVKPDQETNSKERIYIPREVVIACEALGKKEIADQLWAQFLADLNQLAGVVSGKGCHGIAESLFADVAIDAFLAGLPEVTERASAAYHEFMKGSHSAAAKSVSLAREELFVTAIIGRGTSLPIAVIENALRETVFPWHQVQLMIVLANRTNAEGNRMRAEEWFRRALEVSNQVHHFGQVQQFANIEFIQHAPEHLVELLRRFESAPGFIVRDLRLKMVQARLARAETAVANRELAEIIETIDALSGQDREGDLIHLVNFLARNGQCDQAVSTLIKLVDLPGHPNVVVLCGQRLCEAAGRIDAFTETSVARLRGLLELLAKRR